MKLFESNHLKKLGLSLLAGLLIGGNIFSVENSMIKDIVSPVYYDELLKDGYVSRYRDNGSMELLLLPKSIYSEKIKGNMIPKDPKNYPYTFERFAFKRLIKKKFNYIG